MAGLIVCCIAQLAGAEAGAYSLAYTVEGLQTPQGVATLHKRIVRTARDHCPTYREVGSIKDSRACVSEVVDDLIEKVDHEALTAYHRGEPQTRIARAGSQASNPRS
jgi:UrcA family protein